MHEKHCEQKKKVWEIYAFSISIPMPESEIAQKKENYSKKVPYTREFNVCKVQKSIKLLYLLWKRMKALKSRKRSTWFSVNIINFH